MVRRTAIGIALICAVMIVVPGCKKKDKAKDKGKEPAAKVTDMGATAKGPARAAAGKKVLDQIQGAWKFDFDKMKTVDEDLKKAKPEMLAKMKPVFESMKITVYKDKIVADMGKEKKTDKFTVVSDDGKTMVTKSKDEKGVESTATITLMGPSSLRVIEIDQSGPKKGKKEEIWLKR